MMTINQAAKHFYKIIITLFLMYSYCATAVNLMDMKINALADDAIEIVLKFDSVVPVIKDYNFSKTPAIGFDFFNTNTDLKKYNDVDINNVSYINIADDQEKTRMLINLKKLTPYYYNVQDDSVSIIIGRSKATNREKSVTSNASTADITLKSMSDKVYGVTNIDFKSNKDGEGLVVLDLSHDGISIDIQRNGEKIQLEIDGNAIAEDLRNKYDVSDFNTVVSSIDANVIHNKSIIIIDTTAQYDYFAYQTNQQFIISIRGKNDTYLSNLNRDEDYSGNQISLNFKDIEIRSVLQMIADFSGFNLVTSDSVNGSITLHLDQVPWDQALDIVLKTKGLDKRIKDNIILVATLDELTSREKASLENAKQINKLEPITTEIIKVKYSDAEEIALMLKGSKGKNSSLLSEDGSVQIVPRTNSLLIKDSYSKIREIRKLIDDIDLPAKQVMIETRIVAVTSEFKKDIGFKWSISPDNILIGSGRGVSISGSAKVKDDEDASTNGLFTDLSVTGSGIGIGIVKTGDNNSDISLLGLQISAALSDGGGETISQPRIITADKTEATIKSGTQIPYESRTKDGGTSVSFKDALLLLKVKPQITPDNRIILDIKINNDSLGARIDGKDGKLISIKTDELTTRVVIDDGETLALGGVFKHINDDRVTGVPWLSRIPFIGNLFKRTTKYNKKDEVLVFITPSVVKDRLPLASSP